jgi:hypothetical protein
MEAETLNKWVIPVAKIVGVTALVYTGYKLMQKVGIIQTKEERDNANLLDDAASTSTEVKEKSIIAFSPSYRTSIVKAYTVKYGNKGNTAFDTKKQLKFNDKEVIGIIKRLYDSEGTFNDDEDSLMSVFNDIQTQYQLSYISGIFKSVYNKDLLTYLNGFLNAKELSYIYAIVKNYPLYFTK